MTDTRPAIQTNAYLDNPATDWIATDAGGRILSRAGNEAAVRRAAPGAAWYGPIIPQAEPAPVLVSDDKVAVELANETIAATADPVGFATESLDSDVATDEPAAEEEPEEVEPAPKTRKRKTSTAE